jgi:hypothetical protein
VEEKAVAKRGVDEGDGDLGGMGRRRVVGVGEEDRELWGLLVRKT